MLRSGNAAVLFDGDDTLWTVHEAQRGALRLVLEELWSRRPRSVEAGYDVDRLIDVGHRVARELVDRVLDVVAVQLATFERLLEDIGQPDGELASELTSSYFGHVDRLIRMGEGADEVVRDLSEHFQLGLVSRIDPGAWGWADAFSVVVAPSLDAVIADEGSLDLRAVEAALEAFSVEPEAVVLVSRSAVDLDLVAGTYGVVPARIGSETPAGGAVSGFVAADLVELRARLVDARTRARLSARPAYRTRQA